jgi:hypothetical protein
MSNGDDAINSLVKVAEVGMVAGIAMNVLDRTMPTKKYKKKKYSSHKMKPINFGKLKL